MKTVDVPGITTIGFGDFVACLAHLVEFTKESTHYKFWVKQGFDHQEIINELLPLYECHTGVKITWEIHEGDHHNPECPPFRSKKDALKFYDESQFLKSWLLLGKSGFTLGKGKYRNFKQQWSGHTNGPVLVCVNPEEIYKNHPSPQKWLDYITNDSLLSLIDNKTVYQLTNEIRSFEENRKLLERCSFVIGLDSRWAHIANCMNVPYVLLKSGWVKREHKFLKKIYEGHPCLTMIENWELPKYLKIVQDKQR